MAENKDTDMLNAFDKYQPLYMKLVGMLKSRGLVITEDFCKDLAQISMDIFKVGFESGVDVGIKKYEEALKNITIKFGTKESK